MSRMQVSLYVVSCPIGLSCSNKSIVGIPLVAYSPLGRGFLSGQFRTISDLQVDDMRRHLPRFKPEVFGQNVRLVEAVEKVARRKGVIVVQVAISWVVAIGSIPIPGSTKEAQILENCYGITLSTNEMQEIERLLDTLPVAGERYGGKHELLLNQ